MRVDGNSPVTNFPAPVTRLIGRTAAVARLRDLVSAYRVVTLTGPGGIGKTSLALKAARGVVGEFADGGWLVELASLSDPALVPSAVAGVLGLKLSGGGDFRRSRRASRSADSNLLLVLDNCEHVIDAVANLTEMLVRRCPRVTILATSREILRIDGEYVYRVPPLEVPAAEQTEPDHILGHSAVELFIARTQALDADFSPHAEDLPAIAAICRQPRRHPARHRVRRGARRHAWDSTGRLRPGRSLRTADRRTPDSAAAASHAARDARLEL